MGFYIRHTHGPFSKTVKNIKPDVRGEWTSVKDSLPELHYSLLFMTSNGYIQLGYRVSYKDPKKVGFIQMEGCNNKADKRIDNVIYWKYVDSLPAEALQEIAPKETVDAK